MAEDQWEGDGTQIEEETYDDGASATVTEGEDNGDDADESFCGLPDTEVDERKGDSVGNNQSTTLEEDEDDEGDRRETGCVERRRTPSPLRRAGRGSGIFLSESGAAGGGGGGGGGRASSGFLSSAEQSAKAADKGAESSSSLLQPLPRRWLDDQLDAVGTAATKAVHREAQVKAKQKHAEKNPSETADEGTAAVLAQASPQAQISKRVVPGPGGWIRTKSSPCNGGKAVLHAAAAAADIGGGKDDEQSSALGAQAGAVSQSILEIGVPREHRVVDQSRFRPGLVPAVDRTSAAADSEDEDVGEMPVCGMMRGAVNSQELRANEFSQIRKGCSQEKDMFERMLDKEIAGAVADPNPSLKFGVLGESQEAEPEDLGVDGRVGKEANDLAGGGAINLRIKRMRSGAKAAELRQGVDTLRGGSKGRKEATVSRTPSAYIGGPGTKSNFKRRPVPSLAHGERTRRTVFDISSGDSDGGSDLDDEPSRRPFKSHPDCLRASSGDVSTSRDNRRNRKQVKSHVGVPTSSWTKNIRDNGEEEGGKSSIADVRESQGSDDDHDGQVVRTTQDLQMERAMAAIRKASTPVSAQENEDDDAEEKSEEEATPRGRGDEGVGLDQVESEEHMGGGDNAAAGSSSTACGNAGGIAAPDNPGAVVGGSNLVPSEMLEYKTLMTFVLEEEGWKCVAGKGLDSWFYLIAGKKGKRGKKGVDYLVSEEEVVRYVRGNEEMLTRYEAFLRKTTTKEAEARPSADSASAGVAANGAKGSCTDRGGHTSATHSPEAPRRGGKRKAGVVTNGSSRAERSAHLNAEAASISSLGQQQTRDGKRRGDKVDRRHKPKTSPAALESWDSTFWARKWRDEWPKLNQQGWHWVYGTGLSGCIYLKPNVSKKEGQLGIDMFYSRQAVLEHVMNCTSGAGEAVEGDGKGDSNDTESRDVGHEPLQEWNLAKHRETRQGRRGQADTKTTTGCDGKAERKTARPPPVRVVQARRSCSTDTPPGSRAAESPEGDREDDRGITEGKDIQHEPLQEWSLSKHRETRTRRTVQAKASTNRSSSTDSSSSARGQGDGKAGGRGGGPSHSLVQGVVKRKRGRPSKLDPPLKPRPAKAKELSSREARNGTGGEEEAEGSQDEMDDAATQPQFELSSAISMTKLGNHRAAGASPVRTVSAAAAAVFGTACDVGAGSGRVLRAPIPRLAGETARLGQAVVGAREHAGRGSEADVVRTLSTTSNKRQKPSHASDGCSPGGSAIANGVMERSPKQHLARSPSSCASSIQGSGRSKSKRQRSPAGEMGLRSSSRRIIAGPFTGLGVIVTGIQGDELSEIKTTIEKLGGEVVDILKSGPSNEWRDFLQSDSARAVTGRESEESAVTSRDAGDGSSKGEAAALAEGGSTARPRRMIAVASPHSDRHPKFLLAMAAGIPIVHPSYVVACTSMATEVEAERYLLPFTRSAILDHGLIMPGRQPKDRPFQGKKVMLCMGAQGDDETAVNNWVFTFTVAGAMVTLLQEESGERKRGSGGAAGAEASWSTLEVALDQIKQGKIFCVIGWRYDGDKVSASSMAVEEMAVQSGTPSGRMEWAVQCIAHGRFLLPDARTCPWFPLRVDGPSDGGGGDGGTGMFVRSGNLSSKKGKGRAGRERGGRGRGNGQDLPNGARSLEGDPRPFYLHLIGRRRYVAGDYVYLEREKVGTSVTGGRSVGVGAGARATAGVNKLSRIARIISFRREADGKVKVAVSFMKHGDGSKVLVASGREGDGDDDDEVEEEVLGARVLALTTREMEATQLYSLSDGGIFCLRD